MNKYNGRPVLRTPLIVAGNNQKYINKAFASDCDCIVLDLEDGVPDNYKEEARIQIKETINSDLIDHRPIFVRVNSLETGKTWTDIDKVSCENLDGFLYTKPNTAEDIIVFDEMLSKKEQELNLVNGYYKVIVIIETPAALVNVHDISRAAKRVIGLLFGAEDLLGDMEGSHGPDGRSLHAMRCQVLIAARAAGLIPIDTPYIQVHNEDGLRKFIEPSLELGYEGMLLISPSQIPIVKEMYTPNTDQVKDAYKMVTIAMSNDKVGTGVSVVNKLFVSPPTLKRAKKIIKRFENIKKFEGFDKK